MLYRSSFPHDLYVDTYLREAGITSGGETARHMVTRVVEALANAERGLSGSSAADSADFAERLGEQLDGGHILLSPSIMANAGRDPPRPLATCAAPPVGLRNDLATVKAVVDRYHQAGMGTGFNLDDVDDPVTMLQYLNYVAAIGAASETEPRQVGNIALLSLSHPQAEDFVTSKVGANAEGEVWKFNIALRVSDADMQAAIRRSGRERALLFAAAHAAHESAEPALVFGDRLDEANPTPTLGPYTSTAPDAAMGLMAAETSVFGAVNLARFRRDGPDWVDDEALAVSVALLVRALDDAVEVGLPLHPTALSSQVTGAARKIGVGVCGLAELLAGAGIHYDSLDAHRVAQELLAHVNYEAKLASVELAWRRGPCPAVAGGRSRYADPAFLRRFMAVNVRSVTNGDWAALADRLAESALLRNASTTAVPVTPHSQPLFGVSSGIDPARMSSVSSLGALPGARSQLPRRPPGPGTSAAASPGGQLTMAASAQACVDEAVATTIHMPSGTGPEYVYATYVAAWELRCKTIAVVVDHA